MVNLSSNNSNNVRISAGGQRNINVNSPTDNNINANNNGNSQRARSWAIGEGLIDGEDYSAKYWAEQAKISEEIARESIDAENNAHIWAEGTDEEVEAIGGTHSSKGWVDYVIENAPTASVEETEQGAVLTVTDINGTTTATIYNGADGQDGQDGAPGQDGRDGADGADGQDGQDGFSPIATVSKSGNTATISITDANGTTTTTITDGTNGTNGQDGQDGEDGFSPTATVTKSGSVATITITDKNGTTTANVYDGTGGGGGSYSAGTGIDITNDTISIDTSVVAQLSDIPTNVSAFTNDSGYITSSALNGYATQTWVGQQGYMTNTATGSASLTILGTATPSGFGINIGANSYLQGSRSIAIGYGSIAETLSVGIGYEAAATGASAIQLGNGTNTTDNTLQVGNYTLLNTSTGLIPDGRLSSNIARTSQIPTATSDLTNDSGFITNVITALGYTPADNTLSNVSSIDSNSAVQTALNGKADTSLSNLSATGKTVIDGAFTNSLTNIISSDTSLKGSTALPKRIVVPNDGYTYEVIIRARVTTGTTSGNYVRLAVQGNKDDYNVYVCGCQTRSGSSVEAMGFSIVHVSYVASNATNFDIIRASGYNGNVNVIDAISYRRLGTNS